jgi:hypothetical protein
MGKFKRRLVRIRVELFRMGSGEQWIKIVKAGVKAIIRIPTENDRLVIGLNRDAHCWAEWVDGEWYLVERIETDRAKDLTLF